MNMWRWPMLPVLLVLLLAAGGARAGDIVVPRDFFSAGAGTDLREALPHLENKALVSEFLDPGDSGLGKSLGYLLWRELLTAISDQSGAGVILARLPGERRVVDLLRADYHRGAVAIAAGQRARQLLWGQVLEERGAVFVSAQLTLLPQIMGEALTLKYVSNVTGDAEITVTVPRTRYNLALVHTDRTMLFDRPLVTRTTTRLRAGPTAAMARLMSTMPTSTCRRAASRARPASSTCAPAPAPTTRCCARSTSTAAIGCSTCATGPVRACGTGSRCPMATAGSSPVWSGRASPCQRCTWRPG